MNLVQRQIFGNKKGLTGTNTEIGGVASTISTPALLASKLAIDVSRISNFTIVGSDIKCRITGSYTIPSGENTFGFQSSAIPTYYTDTDFLINAVGSGSFYAGFGLGIREVNFQNASSVGSSAFSRVNASRFLLKNVVAIGDNCFAQITGVADVHYIPNATSLGSTSGNNNVFDKIKTGSKIYAHPSLATNNVGGVDGDLAYAISQGAIVQYVTNFTAPNPVTTLASGTIYNTAIQLNFTPPSSTNSIDYYECWANGVKKNNITASGQYVEELTASTPYNIVIIAVDLFFNKSVSNIITTSTNTVDYDPYKYIIASGNFSSETAIVNLFGSLKSNGIYSKMHAFYPNIGTASQQKYNAKNPLNTDAAFRLVHYGSGTFSNLGFQGNGTNSYADTKIYAATLDSLNVGLTVVCGTNNTQSGKYEIGMYQGSPACGFLIAVKENASNTITGSSGSAPNGYVTVNGSSDARGIVTFTATANNSRKLFKNGIVIAQSTAIATSVNPNLNIYLGGLNNQGSPNNFSTQRIQFTAIHQGLTDAEAIMFQSIIDTFENALGRKTW